jgi:hypothetical protein
MKRHLVITFKYFLLSTAILVLIFENLYARVLYGPEKIDDIPNAESVDYYRLKEAKLAYVNWELVYEKFPEVEEKRQELIKSLGPINGEKSSQDFTKKWLLNHFGYISEHQLKLSGIRISKPKVDLSDKVTFAIAPGNGRRSEAQVTTQSGQSTLVSLKGNGLTYDAKATAELFKKAEGDPTKIAEIRGLANSSGVATMPELISETIRERATNIAFKHHNAKNGSSYATVETLFLIDPGYDVLEPDGSKTPAAIYGSESYWEGNGGFMGSDAPINEDKTLSKIIQDPIFGQKNIQSDIFGSIKDYGRIKIVYPPLATALQETEYYLPDKDGVVNPKSKAAKAYQEWLKGNKEALQDLIDFKDSTGMDKLSIINKEVRLLPKAIPNEALGTPNLNQLIGKTYLNKVFSSVAPKMTDPKLKKTFFQEIIEEITTSPYVMRYTPDQIHQQTLIENLTYFDFLMNDHFQNNEVNRQFSNEFIIQFLDESYKNERSQYMAEFFVKSYFKRPEFKSLKGAKEIFEMAQSLNDPEINAYLEQLKEKDPTWKKILSKRTATIQAMSDTLKACQLKFKGLGLFKSQKQ